MQRLRMVTALLASCCSLVGNPFHEAEQSFLSELNSMAGIELAGGPFHAGEQHHFEGEFGYFILAPDVVLPILDQRLSVQTKRLHTTTRSNALPIAPSIYARSDALSLLDARQIHALLAAHGFALRRDEITVLDNSTIQLRAVMHLPLLKMTAPAANTAIALLGSQTWQGIPLYRASFDRTRGEFELDTVRESFVPRRRHEVALREPLLSPQTFFAEPGLGRGDWTKLLRQFGSLDLPAVQILEGSVSERLVTLYADTERPVLPQFWVKLEKVDAQWQLSQAIEFRAEFPRPGPWWTFLPLLPEKAQADNFPDSSVPFAIRREITSIVTRLRGIGRIASLEMAENSSIRVRTLHEAWRGYHLNFKRIDDAWRFTTVTEWSD